MEIKVERRAPYQGVPQWGITGCPEITPSRATAEKWAQLERNARAARAPAGQPSPLSAIISASIAAGAEPITSTAAGAPVVTEQRGDPTTHAERRAFAEAAGYAVEQRPESTDFAPGLWGVRNLKGDGFVTYAEDEAAAWEAAFGLAVRIAGP